MCEFVGQENKGLEQQEEWWRALTAAVKALSRFLTPHIHPGLSAPPENAERHFLGSPLYLLICMVNAVVNCEFLWVFYAGSE